MTDLIGQSIGRYHIREQLGRGGMATVYKAYDTNLERDVAIKVIRRNAFPEEQLDQILKRFEREAKALARLSHPNIVGIIDYGDHEGAPYLVMEYLPGGTLKQQLGKPMPWQEAVHILLPIAQALGYAHDHHIIHRDIKPSNILLTENNQPMLSDFGIAKILEGEDQGLTTTGMGMGTPEYMAPEQWTGQAGMPSDLYSLGVVLYELVTGHKPYTADTPAAILLKQTSEPLPRPSQFVPDLPDGVEKLLIKALARNPEDRYKTMSAMASAMETLLLGAATTVGQTIQQPSEAPTKIEQVAAQALPKPAVPPAQVAQPVRVAAPVTQPRSSVWKKLGIPGIIVVVLTCLCLIVAAGLGYMGIKGKGPLSMLATETSTPTRTPTRTPTPTQEVSWDILGDWDLYATWDCSGEYFGPATITYYDDASWSLYDPEAGTFYGTWDIQGDSVEFIFDESPYSHYYGTLFSADYMEGTIENDEGGSGCWYAFKTTTYSADTGFEGDWELYFDWGCTGTYEGPAAITFNTDFSFSIEGESLGFWGASGEYLDFIFSDAPYADFAGRMDTSGTYMEGTMSNEEDNSGCWYAYKTSSSSSGSSIVGDWELFYDWDCTGDYSDPVLATFYDDLSVLLVEGTDYLTGTWFTADEFIEFILDDYPNADYVGTLYDDNTYMEGGMTDSDGGVGCWYACWESCGG